MRLFSEDIKFLKGNLHMHTTASDGRLSPTQAMDLYRSKGYDFIALTDHLVASPEQMHDGMLVLSGVELDVSGADTWFADQCVHIVGVGVDADAINARHYSHDGPKPEPQSLIDDIRAAGGRAILAHPAWSLNTTELMLALQGLTAAEVYNTFSGEPWNSERADSSSALDILSAHGKPLRLVASDDSHFYTGEAGRSFTMVQAESLTREGILDALDRGAFYASQGPRFHQIEVDADQIRIKCSPVDTITFYSNRPWVGARCRSGRNMTGAVYEIQRQDWVDRFARVVITDRFGQRAWTSPISVC